MLGALLLLSLARAEDAPEAPAAPEPAPSPDDDTLVIEEGSPEELRRRAELYQELRDNGYRKGKRKGEFTVFNAYVPWQPRVLVHDDGWILVKRAPPRIHAPGRSFADEGKKREYLWCLIAPTACISIGGWVVSDAKLGPRIAEVYDRTHDEVRSLNDAVARRAMEARLNTQIPEDLEAIWGRAEVPVEERRRLLFLYWDTRTDTPEGDAAREAIVAFLDGVVQVSATPFTPEELARLNGGRSARDPLALTFPATRSGGAAP
jgi:hypothetical protein